MTDLNTKFVTPNKYGQAETGTVGDALAASPAATRTAIGAPVTPVPATQLAGGFAKKALIAGGAAGNFTVTGIKVGDEIDLVLRFVGAGVAVTDVSDITSEFTITATNTINNTAGTNTTGDKLLILYTKLTA
jgi:hypothetical protein